MHCGCILHKQTSQLPSPDDNNEFYFFWLEVLYTDFLVGKTVLESKDTMTVLRRETHEWNWMQPKGSGSRMENGRMKETEDRFLVAQRKVVRDRQTNDKPSKYADRWRNKDDEIDYPLDDR